MARCETCKTDFLDGAPCPTCGRGAGVVLSAEPGAFRVEGFAPTIVIAGLDPVTGDDRIKVSAPGVSSEARLSQDGQVSLNVEGVHNIGRRGEPQALKTLRQRLQADGLAISTQTGRDNRGEDAILSVGSVSYTVQFVTSPSVREFWREASVGSAVTRVQAEQAVEWVRSTLERKASGTPQEQRANTILALDARHAGVLASKPIIDAYLTRFTPPVQEFAFASVWIVGPTVQHCARLGDGKP